MSRSSLRSFWLLVAVHVALWTAIVLTLRQSDASGYPSLSELVCGVLLYAESVLLLSAAVLWPKSHWSLRALLVVLATAVYGFQHWDRITRIHWYEIVDYSLLVVTVLT